MEKQIIIEDRYIDSKATRKSKEFLDYIKEQKITPNEENSYFPTYKAGKDSSRKEATSKLCSLAGDMLIEFDVMPTAVTPKGPSRLDFANQLGIFYIDNLTD